MAETKTRIEKRICGDCHKEFEATIYIIAIGEKEQEIGGTLCKKCQVEREEKQKENERIAQEMQISSQRKRWRIECGIPPLFQNKDFSTFDSHLQKDAFEKAKKYAQEFPLEKSSQGYPSLLFYSIPPCYGIGKTHLLASIAHSILGKWHGGIAGCPILFTTETDLLLRIRATYDSRGDNLWHEKEYDIFKELETVKLLLFDDIGKEQPQDSRFTQRVYFNVIDGRYHSNLPIVMTSNLNLKQMAEYMGEASVDRLLEMAKGNIIEMKGESYRRKK